ncbi:MAG: dTDP-4-dehydrorhamnose 3,5-epimerase family protein [Ectothiorhodospiraceae bacterium]|jgi:dTDP-4-dehydrorhamnose 3,5-epimerase|nr:dTDP-4-dehydrorhamnose 3,5-epimerase family protein [Ectothiorhodospiraceae bacterium]
MPGTVPILDHAIRGVRLLRLSPNDDTRGSFTEFCREQWLDVPRSVQWNLVHSHARVLRGIHVHIRHYDYLVVIDGSTQVAIGDLRQASPTTGQWDVVTLDARELTAISIPPGVAHGFWFPKRTIHLYGMSEYWCPEEEMGCHWADPALSLDWRVADPIMSARDAELGSVQNLMHDLAPYQHLFRIPA